MITWENKAVMTCLKRGYEVVGFEGGYVFVKELAYSHNPPFPISEEIVAKWINGGNENER